MGLVSRHLPMQPQSMDSWPDVVTLPQAGLLGLSGSAVRHRVRCGQWQRVLRNVHVTHSGPVPAETMLAAMLAYAGRAAALSHSTAAHRHGLGGSRASDGGGRTHVSVPGSRRVCPQPGLVLHYPRGLAPGDVRVVRGLACTSVERTVVDLVATAKTPGTAAAFIVSAVGSRRTTAARLRAAWDRPAVPRQHRGVAREVLAKAELGLHSPLELRFDGNNRKHQLPLGVWQFRAVLRGQPSYLDNIVLPYGLVTETDGREGHEGYDGRLRDNRRERQRRCGSYAAARRLGRPAGPSV